LIANADFTLPGAAAGQAASWVLRSACARESVAAFAPADAVEAFARWTPWRGALGAAAFAPFVPNGTRETFTAWPLPLFASELSAGLVFARVVDAMETGWWTGTVAFRWSDVAQVPGAFAGAPRELFDAWRQGEKYLVAFADAALTRAVLHGAPSELFDGAAWTTKNVTLG
jgi:hypothetical protein